MRALLLALALFPALALARGGGNTAQNNWSRTTLLIPATTVGTTCTSTTGVAVTSARSTSTGYYSDTATTIASASANTPRVESAGLLVEDTRTNRVVRSQEFDNGWTVRGTAVVTADDTTAPDGTVTADKLAGLDTGSNDVFRTTASFGNTKSLSTSIYIKRSSTSGTLVITNPTDGTLGQFQVDLSAIGSGWVRIQKGGTGVTTITDFSSNGSGAAGVQIKAASGGPLTVWAWGADQEQNDGDSPLLKTPTSYIATTSAATTRNRDDYSIDSHLRPGDQDFCLAATITPYPAQPWYDAMFPAFFDLGGNGAANSIRCYGFNNSTDLICQFYDGTTTVLTDERAVPGDSNAHTLHFCVANSAAGTSTITMYVDGVASTQTRSGTGTGKIALSSSTLTKLQIGGAFGNGSQAFPGNFKNIKVCRTADPKRC